MPCANNYLSPQKLTINSRAMRLHILILLILSFMPQWVDAQCNPGQFKITIAEHIPICLTITDGLHTQHRVAQGVWNNTTLNYEIPVYTCQGNSSSFNDCGFMLDTGVCYFLRPFDWTAADPPPLQLKLNAASCQSGLNGFQLEYSQSGRQFNILNSGNTNSYTLASCKPCLQDVIWDQTTSLTTGLIESSSWIKTNASLSPDPNALIRLDANPDSGYIELNDGLSIIPQNGIFMAVCNDGCGPRDPFHKQLNVQLWLQGYYSTISHSMTPALLNQGLNATPQMTDWVHLKLQNATNTTVLFETDANIDLQGLISTDIPYTIQDAVYLGIQHRNSIETYSSTPVIEIPWEYNFTFPTAATQAYGSNQMEVEPGQFALYSGDMNQDGIIDGLDYNEWESDNNNFGAGYLATDLNGDGIVDGLDFLFWEINNNNFVGAIIP